MSLLKEGGKGLNKWYRVRHLVSLVLVFSIFKEMAQKTAIFSS